MRKKGTIARGEVIGRKKTDTRSRAVRSIGETPLNVIGEKSQARRKMVIEAGKREPTSRTYINFRQVLNLGSISPASALGGKRGSVAKKPWSKE